MKFDNKIALILNYLRDKLSPQERHDLEETAINDPFLDDALEGFATIDTDILEADFAELSAQLQDRTTVTKSRSFIPWYKIAAGILLLIVAGISVWNVFQEDPSLTEKQLAESTIVTDSLSEQVATISTEDSLIQDVAILQTEEPLLSENLTEEISPKTDKITLEKKAKEELVSSKQLLAKNEVKAIEATEKALSQAGLSITKENKAITTKVATATHKIEVTGIIYDENNLPLPGVNIAIDGADYSTITDIDGQFKISTLPTDSLIIRHTGYLSTTLTGTELAINNGAINLQEDLYSLDEAITIAMDEGGYNNNALEEIVDTNQFNTITGEVKGTDIATNFAQNQHFLDIEKDLNPKGTSEAPLEEDLAMADDMIARNEDITRAGNTTIGKHRRGSAIKEMDISGVILDQDSTPLVGVNLFIGNSSSSSSTDITGRYRIKILPQEELKIHYLGYLSDTLTGKELAINDGVIILKDEFNQLAEVTMASRKQKKGRASKRKTAITNADPSIDPDKLNEYVFKKKRIDHKNESAITLSFFVETNGRLSEITVVTPTTQEVKAEAKRLLLKGPKWKPAIRNGEKVREKTSVVIYF